MKTINLKKIMIILVSVMLIALSTTAFATESVLGDTQNNNGTTITKDEYENAQTVPTNNTNNNNASGNNTNNNNTSLPQTGIEDTGLGLLLIAGIASAIFAYKKISEYRNI